MIMQRIGPTALLQLESHIHEMKLLSNLVLAAIASCQETVDLFLEVTKLPKNWDTHCTKVCKLVYSSNINPTIFHNSVRMLKYGRKVLFSCETLVCLCVLLALRRVYFN